MQPNTRFHRINILAGLVVSALFIAHPVVAQTDVTGTNTGDQGMEGPGNGDANFSQADPGNDGYDAAGNTTYTVHDANFTGGQGGTVDGGQPVDGNGTIANNYQGGTGGEGISSEFGATTTINSGRFTGGLGGTASGTANQLTGGYGGDGLFVFYGTAFINAGTFRGASGGMVTGSTTNAFSGFAGSGANLNTNSTTYINGGTFLGANGATQAGVNDYGPGNGLVIFNGNAFIHGGTFTGGAGGYGLDVGGGDVTLFGTFTVNGVANYTGTIMPGTGTITGYFDNGTTDETFTYDVSGGVLNIVPEPSTWVMMGLGAGLLGLTLRQRCARRV